MKKLVLIICFMFFPLSTFAEEEVQLELDIPAINMFNTGSLNFGNTESEYDDEKFLKPSDSFYSIKELFKEDFCKNKKNETNKTEKTKTIIKSEKD